MVLLINLFEMINGEESWLGWKRLCVLEEKVRTQGYDVCSKRDKNTNVARRGALELGSVWLQKTRQ